MTTVGACFQKMRTDLGVLMWTGDKRKDRTALLLADKHFVVTQKRARGEY